MCILEPLMTYGKQLTGHDFCMVCAGKWLVYDGVHLNRGGGGLGDSPPPPPPRVGGGEPSCVGGGGGNGGGVQLLTHFFGLGDVPCGAVSEHLSAWQVFPHPVAFGGVLACRARARHLF